MKAAVIILIACYATLACAQGTNAVFETESRSFVVDRATKVEACILRVEDPSRGTDLSKRTFVEGRFKPLPEEIRALLIWKLLDHGSYTWDSSPACIPTYNARVRFTRDTRIVDVDFCFGCSLIRVIEEGRVVGGGYFYPGSDWVFRALALEFRRDPVIREVQKKREELELFRLQVEMAKARDARKEKANQMLEPTSGLAPDRGAP